MARSCLAAIIALALPRQARSARSTPQTCPITTSEPGLAFGGQLELAYASAVSCPGPLADKPDLPRWRHHLTVFI
jgi:hypothetical protein